MTLVLVSRSLKGLYESWSQLLVSTTILFLSTSTLIPLKKGILDECILISSLPGKVLRKLVDIASLAQI